MGVSLSTTVAVGGFEISSNHESAASMVDSLTPQKEEAAVPRVLVDEGKAVPRESSEKVDEKTGLSRAAAELGKEGGKAAAAKRAAEVKAKPIPEVKPAEEEAKADEGNPRHDPKARMLEATREAAEVKRQLASERAEREHERAELAQLRSEREQAARQQPQPAQRPQPTEQTDDRPKEGDFQNYADFVEARSRWAAKQEFAQQFEARRQEAFQRFQADAYHRAVQGKIDEFNGRLTEAAGGDPEFHGRIAPEVLGLQPSFTLADPRRLGPQNVIADEIINSEKAPALMLHFTEHPEDLQRLATLGSPREISREMAKLEGRLEAATAGVSPKPPQASKAPPPFAPVKGSPNAAEPDLHGDIDFDTFVSRSKARKR